jgi:hypothetical protein
MIFEEDPNLRFSPLETDGLKALSGTSIPSSSSACICSEEKLRSKKALKGAKRVFDLQNDSTSSTASSCTNSVTLNSNSPSKRRPRTQPDQQAGEEILISAR